MPSSYTKPGYDEDDGVLMPSLVSPVSRSVAEVFTKLRHLQAQLLWYRLPKSQEDLERASHRLCLTSASRSPPQHLTMGSGRLLKQLHGPPQGPRWQTMSRWSLWRWTWRLQQESRLRLLQGASASRKLRTASTETSGQHGSMSCGRCGERACRMYHACQMYSTHPWAPVWLVRYVLANANMQL